MRPTHRKKYIYNNSHINCGNDKKNQRFYNNQFGSYIYRNNILQYKVTNRAAAAGHRMEDDFHHSHNINKQVSITAAGMGRFVRKEVALQLSLGAHWGREVNFFAELISVIL